MTLTVATHESTETDNPAKTVRAKMRQDAYLFGNGARVLLLVPAGAGPADASQVAREMLQHDGELTVLSTRTAGDKTSTYVTYETA